MKNSFPFSAFKWVVISLFCSTLWQPLSVQAQVSTTLDSSFQMPVLYQRSRMTGALVLSDGSYVCAGDFSRAEGLASGGLVRYLPNGQPDRSFVIQTRLNTWQVEAVRETVGGKLFVQFTDTARVSGQLCASIVRLMPNGRRDSTFRSPAVPWNQVDALLALPDGSLLIAPRGQGLRRLLPNGNPDAGFFQQYGSTIRGGNINSMVRQTNGRVLIGGDFIQVQGVGQGGLTRMLPNGSLDASYQPNLRSYQHTSLTLQADGKLLVKAGYGTAHQDSFFRLDEATGARDNTFRLDPSVDPSYRLLDRWPEVQLQADGSILLAANRLVANRYRRESVVRLTSTGAYDPTWNLGANVRTFEAESVQLLPSGNVLLTSLLARPFGSSAQPLAVAVLSGSTGSYLPAATPRLQKPGLVSAMVRQADGKIVVVGVFTEINGQQSNGLVRLHPNGTVDASYNASCPLFPWANWPAEQQLALQTDGKLLVSGFSADGGFGRGPRLLRLLPSGCPDFAFSAGYLDNPYLRGFSLQTDGKILLNGGLSIDSSFSNHEAIRLNPDGSIDRSFGYTSIPFQSPVALVAQPDGSALALTEGPVAGGWRTVLQKLDAGGNVAAGYAAVPLLPSLRPGWLVGLGKGFVRDGASRQLVFGEIGGAGAVASPAVVRMLPNGVPDPTFSAAFFGSVFAATAVAVQPNGSVLVGCEGDYNVQRLLPTGSFDPSFNLFQGPRNGIVNSILVEPSGGILVGGDFWEPGTGSRVGMLRLLDPNVLTVAPTQAAARTAAYPVPAHNELHLSLDAAARPRQVQLLDALGRAVLTQAVTAPDLTLNTAHLPAGLYLLQVQYTGQTVTRRVVLE